ncbi:hypothetical protein ACFQL4_01030 [Halosimplex aquaticum]
MTRTPASRCRASRAGYHARGDHRTARPAAGIVLVGILVFLLYSVAGATMEFVFVASLRDEEVRLRRYFKRYWRRGARLFAFRFLVWTLSAGAAAGVLLGVGTGMSGWPPTGWSDGTILAVILLAIPIFLFLAVVVGTLLGFTTMFVVPVMLREDRGVIGGWRRFWSTLVGNLVEFLAYLFVSFLLSIAVGMAVSFLLVLVAVAFAVPFLVVGAPLLFVLGSRAPADWSPSCSCSRTCSCCSSRRCSSWSRSRRSCDITRCSSSVTSTAIWT